MKAKMWKIVIFVGIIIISVMSSVLAEPLKIGYVDIREVFNNYKKAEVQNKKLDEATSKKQKEREKFIKDIQKLREEMKIMSEEGKKEKRSVLEEKILELRKFDSKVRSNLRMKRDKMMKEILEDIRDVIKIYAKKNDFDLIFYRNALLYNVESLDVTQEIIDILNSKYKKAK